MKIGLRTGTAVLFVTAPLQVWAQTAGEPADSFSVLEEIIVTAQKREERLLDVPQSMSAVTADDLARLNATQLRDYANTIPALTVNSIGGAGQSQLTIRGVTSGVDTSPTVGVYVDDVPYGSSTVYGLSAGAALDAGLFDLDRIEVLRGPQGTLYGASSMGGLLKYVTRRPSMDRFDAVAQAGLSFTKDGGTNYNGAAALSGPVADKLGVRASGYYSRDGGYIDNVALGEEDVGRSRIYGGRLDLMLEATDELSIRLGGFAQNLHRDGTAQSDYTLGGRPVDGEIEQRRLLREPFEQSFRLVSATIDYDFGGAMLTSISSYQTGDTRFRADGSALYIPLLAFQGLNFGAAALDAGAATDKFTQEVRLTSSGEGMIEWIVGGFYTDEKTDAISNLVMYDLSGAVSPIDLLTSDLPSTYEELAGFGNLTVHLSERFDVTGGLRYAHNEQSYTQNATGLLAPSAPRSTSREDVTTYLANARYRFSERATAYARFATGYRPGGPNVVTLDPLTGVPLAPLTFEADTLKSYEVGFKGETADRGFGIDLAVYHIDWDDMQVQSAQNGVQAYRNANSAEVDGAELTLTARPSRSVILTGAFAYQDARLAEDTPGLGARKGEQLPNVPEFTAAMNADYRWDNNAFQPSAGATLRYVSDRSAAFNGNPQVPQYDLGDYVTLDLRAGATFGPIDTQLFVRNLFDDRGQGSAITQFASLGGPAHVAILQPRTIGVSATTRF